MATLAPINVDPARDLVLERVIDVPIDLVWTAWTTPEHLKHWFCPKPWAIAHCEMDLRPGGAFSFDMRSPDDGSIHPYRACYLEIVPQQRLVWTFALEPGFRPSSKSVLPGVTSFTAVVTMIAQGSATKYTATVLHNTAAEAKAHDEMGFSEGWAIVLDQMVEYIRTGT